MVSMALLAAPQDVVPLRRFALLVGANDGGPERPALRFAIADASAFGKVLVDLGGVRATDRRLLENPDVETMRGALQTLRDELAGLPAAQQRIEVILYYSGHSDEEGLLLKGARLPYSELRTWLATVPAAVRIAILDSCASGTLTRGKGGVRAPPFLLDASTQVHGHAILTSSSDTEASQESDRIGGSFFTHALLSAMRGAADGTHDGRVTLNEAYQFSFDETLARTEKTRGGAQHPAYDIQLVGTGDLVMTDLHVSAATLVLPEALVGRFFVRDAQGQLVAELRKFGGRLIELGLEASTYTITRELDGVVSEGSVGIAVGDRLPLETRDFRVVRREATAARGTASEPSEYRWVPVEVSFFPSIAVSGDPRVLNNLSMTLLGGRSSRLEGAALTIGGSRIDEALNGAQLSVGFNSVGGSVHGAQLSVGANIASEDVTGVQLAVGANVTRGAMLGLQSAVGLNVATDRFSGVQLGVGGNVVAQSLHGFQFGVGFNGVGRADAPGDRSSGVQASVGVNYASTFSGAQLSLINTGGDLGGAQVGLINFAGTLTGTQVGLINLAGAIHGAQIGLLNGALEVDGESVGLIAVVRDGLHLPQVWFEDSSLLNAGVQLGGRHLYVLPTIGLIDSKRFAAGIGLGAHITTQTRFSVDVDAMYRNVTSFTGISGGVWASLRGIVHYRVFEYLDVFAGPTLNFYADFDHHSIARFPQWGAGPGAMWVGAAIGISL